MGSLQPSPKGKFHYILQLFPGSWKEVCLLSAGMLQQDTVLLAGIFSCGWFVLGTLFSQDSSIKKKERKKKERKIVKFLEQKVFLEKYAVTEDEQTGNFPCVLF